MNVDPTSAPYSLMFFALRNLKLVCKKFLELITTEENLYGSISYDQLCEGKKLEINALEEFITRTRIPFDELWRSIKAQNLPDDILSRFRRQPIQSVIRCFLLISAPIGLYASYIIGSQQRLTREGFDRLHSPLLLGLNPMQLLLAIALAWFVGAIVMSVTETNLKPLKFFLRTFDKEQQEKIQGGQQTRVPADEALYRLTDFFKMRRPGGDQYIDDFARYCLRVVPLLPS